MMKAGTERQETEPTRPLADRWMSADALEIRIDLPGVRREDVRLTLEGRELLLEAEPAELAGELVGERRLPRRYRRLFTLPESTDPERAHARMSEGVLRLTIPTAEGVGTQTIPIDEE